MSQLSFNVTYDIEKCILNKKRNTFGFNILFFYGNCRTCFVVVGYQKKKLVKNHIIYIFGEYIHNFDLRSNFLNKNLFMSEKMKEKIYYIV